MNIRMTVLAFAALLLAAGQAAAQSGDADEREALDTEERNADVERRMQEAERRMAEAARQIAELSSQRLPKLGNVERHLEFVMDDKPRLGVTIGGENEDPVEGPAILGVTPGSAAEDAGLRAGDIITAVNGETMSAASSKEAASRLLDFMAGIEAGDTLDIEYLRDGKTGKVEVEPRAIEMQVFSFTGNRPGFDAPLRPGLAGRGPGAEIYDFHWKHGSWGDLELVELNKGLGRYFGTEEGLLVVNAPSSGELKLENGDVIQSIDGRKPTSVRHALRILASYQAGESLQLDIMRDKKQRTLAVEIPADRRSGSLSRPAPPMIRPSRAPAPPRAPAPVERT